MAFKPGEVLSEKAFYTVKKATRKKVSLITDSGKEVIMEREYVEQNLQSSAGYSSIKEATRTELAQIVLNNPGIAIGLSYNKKLKEDEIADQIIDLYPNKGKMFSKADFEKSVRATLSITGEERTMYGRHNGHLNDQGRLSFIDMNEADDSSKSYDTRTRLVDTRTLNWVIVGGVMYKQKK